MTNLRHDFKFRKWRESFQTHIHAYVAISILIILTLMSFSIIVLSVLAETQFTEQIYADIKSYIRREPWMVPGGTLRIPLMADVNTLNPFTFTTSWEFYIIDGVYDTLMILTPDLKYAPRLAKSWSMSPDGKVWTFKLFENATWHDGTPVTADDVAFTFNKIIELGTRSRHASIAPVLEKAEVIDKHTVKIYLKKPYAPFLYMIASAVYIVPKHLWENVTDIVKYFNDRPIGSGPFIFVERVPQQYIKLVANTKYHLGRPLIDGIVFPIISNPDAMLLALKKGEIDAMTWSIPYASLPQVKDDPNIKIATVSETGARYAYFNCRRWPTNLTEFRKAVHHAINLTYVVQTIYQGYAIPGSLGRLPPTLTPWAHPKLLPKEQLYPFNLTKAAEILNKLGIKDVNNDGWRETPDGKPFTITIYSPSYDPLRVRWAQILADNLNSIGVKTQHQPLEWTTLVNKLNSGDFDILVIGGVGSLDPDILYGLFNINGTWNKGYCSFPDLNILTEQQRYETNITKRIEIVRQIQEKLAEYLPLLNVVHQIFVFAYRTDNFDGWVIGPYTDPANWFSLMNVYSVKLAKPPTTTTATTTVITTTTPITTTAEVKTSTPTTVTQAAAINITTLAAVIIVIVAVVLIILLLYRRRS